MKALRVVRLRSIETFRGGCYAHSGNPRTIARRSGPRDRQTTLACSFNDEQIGQDEALDRAEPKKISQLSITRPMLAVGILGVRENNEEGRYEP